MYSLYVSEFPIHLANTAGKPEAMPPTLWDCVWYVPSMKSDESGVIVIVQPLSSMIAKSSDVIEVKLGLLESAKKAISALMDFALLLLYIASSLKLDTIRGAR